LLFSNLANGFNLEKGNVKAFVFIIARPVRFSKPDRSKHTGKGSCIPQNLFVLLMKNVISIFFFFFLYSWGYSQDTSVQSKIKYHVEKAEKYLDKEKALSPYYSIDKDGIKMYASNNDKLNNKVEFLIKWDQSESFNKCLKTWDNPKLLDIYKKGYYEPSLDCTLQEALQIVRHNNQNGKGDDYTHYTDMRKLFGLKIAIDAGHIAGDMEMGEIEKKSLKFKRDSINKLNDSIEIAEGALTFATAKLLKEKLEAEGAEVFMTRTFNNSSAFGVTFDDWLKTDYKATVDSLHKIGKLTDKQYQFFTGPKASKRDKFRVVFKDIELEKRAEIINNYKPDFTVIIHYNVDETNTGWEKPCNKDFNMAFVGGAFMKNDLSSPAKRFEFLRLLISTDLEKSIALSAAVVKSFEENLKVKTATIKDAKYLSEGCLSTTQNGVYCRNLQLNRYIHSPLVYGETLYQDNINECSLLNKECDKTKNERVKQVAEAYFQGILNYVKSK
jgi:N-acetylmuramoyl-L-alanine amidase